MRRGVAVFLLLMMLALSVSGCGVKTAGIAEPDKTVPTPKPQEELPPTTETPQNAEAPEGLSVEMEHAVYDPSVERYTYFVRNNTDRPTGMFGEPYWVQKQENGQWRDLEAQDGMAFTSIGYGLQPGGVMALTCGMGAFSEERTPGKYRLVKEIEDELGRETYTLYAEFEIGESIYTADAPYGFESLESLPDDYGADTAGEMDVVFTGDGTKNLEAVEEFLFKSGLDVDCQLRTVQDYGEGAPMVIDVIYENDHFLWKMWSEGVIVEKRFSYIVTDGEKLYLSNGTDWESTVTYDSDKVLLIPEGVTEKLLETAAQQTAARLEGNVTRYKIWSDDTGEGVWNASLWDADSMPECATEFSVEFLAEGGGGWGSMYNLQNWDGLETAITGLDWQGDGTLCLTCDTAEGSGSVLQFNPETEELTTAFLMCGGVPLEDK